MERPPSWPADLPLTDLRELEGTFVDRDGWMKEILHWADVLREKNVRIGVESSSMLSFEFTLEDGTQKRVSRPVKIVDGWAVVTHGRGVNRDAVVAYESLTFSMRLDATGALILKFEQQTIGTMFLVPGIGKDVRWSRLRRMPD
ncbi:MAG TPA: hypothetical protein VIK52_05280 [Opitutaceae bacterium]